MKLVFVGASRSLPREGCEYEDTYFYKFQKSHKDVDCISFFKRAFTSDGLDGLFNSYIKYYHPEIVISHTGATDCAPRIINDKSLFWKFMIKIVNRLGCLKLFWKIVKFFFKRSPNRVYVSVDEFRNNIIGFTNKLICLGVDKIIYLKISPYGNSVVVHNQYINDNVERYNEVFDEVKEMYPKQVEIIFPLEHATDADYLDGMHATPAGHDIFLKYINDIIDVKNLLQ